MLSKVNLLLVDDEALFRAGLISLLKQYNVVSITEAENGEQALTKLKLKKSDVVLLDLEMPVLNGSKTLDNIIQRFPSVGVVIISSYHDEQLIKDHFNRGAKAYVSKKENIEYVVAAILIVAAGGVYTENIPGLLKVKCFKDRHYYKLMFTTREQEIIPLACTSISLKEIGAELFISERTVETHLTAIYKKLGVENRQEFIRMATKEGLHYLGKPFRGSK
jgi:two-component system, NarL family, response regulator DegU